MASPTIKRTALKNLKRATYNPASRTADVSGLMESMEDIGLIYPVVVSPSKQIIDGHRRVKAAKELGWDTIPIITIPNENIDQVFAQINATGRRMSGTENLQIWLKNPEAVTWRSQCLFEAARKDFGIAVLRSIAKENKSLMVCRLANSICRYCGEEVRESQIKAARWVLKHRMQQLARQFMETGQSPAKLWEAVEANRPVKTVMTTV